MSDLPPLPPGFVPKTTNAASPGGDNAAPPLPPSFVPKASASLASPKQGIAESLWDGLKNFGKGVAGGVSGEGVPAGRASEQPGGRSEFGGRMVGAGARAV